MNRIIYFCFSCLPGIALCDDLDEKQKNPMRIVQYYSPKLETRFYFHKFGKYTSNATISAEAECNSSVSFREMMKTKYNPENLVNPVEYEL